MLKLYYAPGSCAFAALVALEEAGADYEPLRLDLAAGDQRSPAYRAINPLGRVPALVADDRILTESAGVLTYIAARFPSPTFCPFGDAANLALAYDRLSWFSTSFHIHIAQIFRGERFADDPAAREALKEPARRSFIQQLDRLEQACARSPGGLIDGKFTIVDAFSLVIWRWAEKLNIQTSVYPSWAASVARDFARPAVARAIRVEADSAGWQQADGR